MNLAYADNPQMIFTARIRRMGKVIVYFSLVSLSTPGGYLPWPGGYLLWPGPDGGYLPWLGGTYFGQIQKGGTYPGWWGGYPKVGTP